ncbi:ComEA family DNA-binding protein [Cyanobium gracile]|uniref:DNA uptake protein n=1 Tax=Cyanobium gracile (strain ATCC 27147 / PCC 6307) TaxID=292564 RepID=K9P9X2_CYAGP|nr:DNA uptake protein [Cyanobium gracile]AFY30187.1 DNA uptake protein [Cyanobium gracile PCC 6307]
MAGRHWLDPLARRLLEATGQLPPLPPPQPGAVGTGIAGMGAEEAVERELLALKLALNPALRFRDGAEVRQAAALGWSLEVNLAEAGDWLRLPGCPPELVDRLIRLQGEGHQWSGPGDLAAGLQVSSAQVGIWLPVLRFRRRGRPRSAPLPPPLAINQASERLLQERLGLGPERCRWLLQERARQPFRDLADLQHRLEISPEQVERWIGRFRYDAAPGPVLPPARRRAR